MQCSVRRCLCQCLRSASGAMEEEEVLTLRPLFEETLVEPTNQLELDFGPGRHVQRFFFEFKQLKGANGCDSDDWFIVRAI